MTRRLIVKIGRSANVPSLATFPDENLVATVKEITFDEISDTVAFQAFGIDFAGNVTDSIIRGTATQNGVGTPFALRRQPTVDIVGDWRGYLEDDTAFISLHVKETQAKLSATAESPYLHKTVHVLEIRVADQELEFTVATSVLFPNLSTPGLLRFKGIVYSDSIRGTLEWKDEQIPVVFKRE